MLKVHATACESDSTSASTPSLMISVRIRPSLSVSALTGKCRPSTRAGANGRRRSMQPWIKSEAVVGDKMLRQPVFGRRIDQRLDAPGLAIDLFRGLQRIAAI